MRHKKLGRGRVERELVAPLFDNDEYLTASERRGLSNVREQRTRYVESRGGVGSVNATRPTRLPWHFGR